MNYADARNRIGSGDVLAWSHKGWSSFYDFQVQMVRLFTRSEYCHVGMAWVIGGRVFVLEAVSSGVRIMPLSRLLPCYWLRLARWSDTVEELALAKVGQPYSKWQALLAGFGMLKVGEDSHWQCAEYVMSILRYGGLKLHCPATPSGVVDKLLEVGCQLEMLK